MTTPAKSLTMVDRAIPWIRPMMGVAGACTYVWNHASTTSERAHYSSEWAFRVAVARRVKWKPPTQEDEDRRAARRASRLCKKAVKGSKR